MLIAALIDSYFIYLTSEKNMASLTIKSYNNDWMDFLYFLENKAKFDLAALTIEEIDHGLIRRYLADLSNRGLAKTTIARRLAALKSFFRYLQKKEMIAANPMAQFSTPKIPKRLPKYLDVQEMSRVIEQPKEGTDPGKRDKAILELLYGTGIRVSELVGMDVTSLDLSYGYIRVFGKGSRERLVPLGKAANQALDAYLRETRPRWDVLNAKALFLNKSGGRLTDRSVRSIVKKYCRKAGAKEILSPHGFRHSYASHLLDNGADLRVVQELLGHKKISSTQIYTHVSRAQLRKVYHLAHPRA